MTLGAEPASPVRTGRGYKPRVGCTDRRRAAFDDRTGLSLGLLTVWPTAFFAFWAAQLATGDAESGPDWLGSLAVFTILLTFALAAYYAWQAATNRRINPAVRTGWILMIIVIGPLAMPVYWYRHVWAR